MNDSSKKSKVDVKINLYPAFPRKYTTIKKLREKFFDGAVFEDKDDRPYTIKDFKPGDCVRLISIYGRCSLVIFVPRPRGAGGVR